jgi:hypothetical protein
VARWRLVNDAEREELRSTPVEVKARQLASLMGMAVALGWTEALAAEAAEVRERWIRLRKAYGL